MALILASISFFVKIRLYFLLLQTGTHLFYVAGLGVMSAWSGAVILGIGMILGIILYFQEKNNLKPQLWLIIATCLCYTTAIIFTWAGYISLITFVSNLVFTFGMWQTNKKVFLFCQVIASVLSIIYNTLYTLYTGVVLEAIALIVAIVALIKILVEKKVNKT